MTTFLLDIWHDLREKRLWPVAVAMLVATVALPVVLMKPTAGAPPAETPPSTETASLPAVSLDQGTVDGSRLDAFEIKDPFASHADKAGPVQTASSEGITGAAAAAADAASGAKGSSLAGGSGGGTAGGPGGTAPGGSGSGSGGGTRYYTYTVDVRFGARGKEKTYKGMRQLDLLPSSTNPVVSYMGLRDDAKTAVFFIVDPSYTAEGEGQCVPTEDNCRFVYLRVDDDQDEAVLSAASGAIEYVLRLTGIHTRTLSAGEALGDTTPDTTPDDSGAAAKRKQVPTLLTLPQLAVEQRP
ncbi:MAG TPA: hypothetical protein VF520_08245 [Thermoleophilaceae bacterium]|jgi:hypothetical protein